MENSSETREAGIPVKQKFLGRLHVSYVLMVNLECQSAKEAEQRLIDHYYKIYNREHEAAASHESILKISSFSEMYKVDVFPEKPLGTLA